METSPSLIEQYPGWQENLNLAKAVELLESQAPFTHLVSSLPKPSTYLLSYIRKDKTVAQVQFVQDKDTDSWCYKNGSDNTFGTLREMIKQAMHCEEDPIPLVYAKGLVCLPAPAT